MRRMIHLIIMMKLNVLKQAFSGCRLVMIYVMNAVVMTAAVKMTVVSPMVHVLAVGVNIVMELMMIPVMNVQTVQVMQMVLH